MAFERRDIRRVYRQPCIRWPLRRPLPMISAAQSSAAARCSAKFPRFTTRQPTALDRFGCGVRGTIGMRIFAQWASHRHGGAVAWPADRHPDIAIGAGSACRGWSRYRFDFCSRTIVRIRRAELKSARRRWLYQNRVNLIGGAHRLRALFQRRRCITWKFSA